MKKNEKVEIVIPGMYDYSDGTISAEVLSEKQISGVVGWVDDSGQHGLVLGLRETDLPWSSNYLAVPFLDGPDGLENTSYILERAQIEKKKAEAAEWCAAYAFDGIQAGKAFLPTKFDWVKIYTNIGAVQEALERINQPQLKAYETLEGTQYWLKTDKWYCSSSQNIIGRAEVVCLVNGDVHLRVFNTNTSHLVRCAWKF